MEVHDTIRKIRELNEFTQEDMAEKLDISVNGYSKIERGISKLNLEKLEQIANIFHINVSDLYSAKEKGIICLFSDNNNHHNSTYYTSDDTLVTELEKAKLVIAHKEEIIEHQEKQIQMLEEMVKLLKTKEE